MRASISIQQRLLQDCVFDKTSEDHHSTIAYDRHDVVSGLAETEIVA